MQSERDRTGLSVSHGYVVHAPDRGYLRRGAREEHLVHGIEALAWHELVPDLVAEILCHLDHGSSRDPDERGPVEHR